MCMFGILGPPDRAAGARTRQLENSKRAHFRAPALQKHHSNSTRNPQRDTETAKWWREKEETARNFGPPPFGALRGPTTSGPHFFWVWPPTLWGPTMTPKILAKKLDWPKLDWPKLDWPKLALAKIGRPKRWPKMDWPKLALAKIGRPKRWPKMDWPKLDWPKLVKSGWPKRDWPKSVSSLWKKNLQLQDNVLLPSDVAEHIYIDGIPHEKHSTIQSGLIPGGKRRQERETCGVLYGREPNVHRSLSRKGLRRDEAQDCSVQTQLLRVKDCSSVKRDQTRSFLTTLHPRCASRRW